jgi:hypothetical protein
VAASGFWERAHVCAFNLEKYFTMLKYAVHEGIHQNIETVTKFVVFFIQKIREKYHFG